MACVKEELERRTVPGSEQIRNLVADNMQWREKYMQMRRERDAALAKVKQMEEGGQVNAQEEEKQKAESENGEGTAAAGKGWKKGRRNPDGTRNPASAPKMRADGRYTHPAPPIPNGFYWDYNRGLWVPDFDQPSGGRVPDGYDWDYELREWVISPAKMKKLEEIDPKRKRARLNPDGTMTPANPPTQMEDGTYARQKGGRTPKGYNWDARRGLWVPKEEGEEEVEEEESEDEETA